jgi:tetratricopeptide (TPR) repeat protein
VAPEAEEPADLAARVRLLAESLEAAPHVDAVGIFAGLGRHASAEAVHARAGHASVVHDVLEHVLAALRAGKGRAFVSTACADAAAALGALADFAGARALLGEASRTDDETVLCKLAYVRAKIAFCAFDWGAAAETFSNTVLPSNPRERVAMLLILGPAVVSTGGTAALPWGLDLVSRAEALVRESSADPVLDVQCLKARVLCLIFAGDHVSALEAASATVALARRAGLRYEESIHLHNVGQECAYLGDAERARDALLQAHAIARDLGAERLSLHDEALLAYLDGRAGRLEEIAETFRAAGQPHVELELWYWLGRLLASRAAPGARHAFARALALARDHKMRTMADECEAALQSCLEGPDG